jgi:hypothetical protein
MADFPVHARIVTGVPGSVYSFNLDTGEQLNRWAAKTSQPDDRFGSDLDLDGSLGLIGAPGYWSYPDHNRLGSVYVVDVGSGEVLRELTPEDQGPGLAFGYSVAIAETTAVVGAPAANGGAGVVYGFDLETGRQLYRFAPPRFLPGDHFGFDVAAHGSLALIGAKSEHGAFLIPRPKLRTAARA